MDKIFKELEASNLAESEEARQQLVLLVASTKEPWVVNGMIEYYAQTNSIRIVDVLVKVQIPHDKYIFDKLEKYLHVDSSQKVTALTLFGYIVRKHPTWLYKVVGHSFFKILLKLLKTEKDIVTFTCGLLHIVKLLPIIPAAISNFLQDLFEIFNYLATWTCINPQKLPECQLIHLQFCLYTLFNRLYGMYPCNFTTNLKQEYVLKDKSVVFNQTIRPLLDRVRIHPLLLTGNDKTEINPARWKKMEPHDIVMECNRYSLENDATSFYSHLPSPIEGSSRPINGIEFTSPAPIEMPPLPAKHLKLYDSKFESLWSPSHVILATPPPTGTMPNTPTPQLPNFNNFNIPKLTQAQMQAQLLGPEGTSPPEAAVEATPETTPMKSDKAFHPYPVGSQAARAIWPKSQPSSPMKKEQQSFNYPQLVSPPAPVTQPTQSSQAEQATDSSSKLLRLVNDRHQLVHSFSNSSTTSPSINEFLTPAQLFPKSTIRYDSPSIEGAVDSTREDQEVLEINSQNVIKSPVAKEVIKDAVSDNEMHDDDEMVEDECCEEDTTLIGSDVYQPYDFVRRVKRLRMVSHCLGDSSSCFSAGTSPADVSYMKRYASNNSSNRLKKFSSCSDLNEAANVEKEISSRKPAAGSGTGPDINSSPSDEAISAVSHFNLFRKIRKDLNSNPLELEKVSSASQTVEIWPEAHEALFHSIFSEEMRLKNSPGMTVFNTTTTTTTVNQTAGVWSPKDLVDQYIQSSLKIRKNAPEYHGQIELLSIRLQYEQYRREIHAERNRRLLGKSRQTRGLEQLNTTLNDQVHKLTQEIVALQNLTLTSSRSYAKNVEELQQENRGLQKKLSQEQESGKILKREKESLEFSLEKERQQKKQISSQIEVLNAEIFDLKNDLDKARHEADLGRKYHDQLIHHEAELIILHEAQFKCNQKLIELENLKAKETDTEQMVHAYLEESRDLKKSAQLKTSQVDSYRARCAELEALVKNKEAAVADQKRHLKVVKDEYEEKFNALEQKYATQKAIMVKMDEHILELNKNQSAVNLATMSPESDRTVSVGSLDHTSPLSLSLSSDGASLSASLRSTTEIKNLQFLAQSGVEYSVTTASENATVSNFNNVNIPTNAESNAESPSAGPSQPHFFLKK